MAKGLGNGRINLIIRVLIFSDFLMLSAVGFINPIFALFITSKIAGASLAVVGYSATILLVVKSLLQIPIANYIDRTNGEIDDLYWVVGGSVLISVLSILYIFITRIWHLYLLQALWGVGGAMAYPGWYALFSRHTDRNREGFEWGIYSTIVGLGVAVAAAAGGVMAQNIGFNAVFVLVGVISLVGSLLLFLLRKPILELDAQQRRGENNGR